ncbi:MAG TPA: DEAD/DEAH box helicase [Thermoprotei archaeon]|nr:DEAD/DEAH box helicase [Thermoprotei archaeon]
MLRRIRLEEDDILRELSKDKAAQIVHAFLEPSSEIEYGGYIDELNINSVLKNVLKNRGIIRFYRFQEIGIRKIMEGKDIVIVAGTGTGKTETFLIPILNDVLNNPFEGTKALLIYPTKALARDQAKRIDFFTRNLFGVRYAIFDGDIDRRKRDKIFMNPPPILITNPDMIHVSLIYSENFKKMVKNVKYIVFDDFHVYSGVFGTHVAYVFRRLNRFLGNVQVIGSTATIRNPLDFSKKLFGRDMDIVMERGSRRGDTIHVFIKPIERSKFLEALKLIKFCQERNFKTILFADSHRVVEFLKRLGEKYGLRLYVHRAGLRPEERTEVEKRFREGEINTVVATPTLELGIDIGHVDTVILFNIPATFSKYIQRIGRGGRRGQKAYVFTILGNDPISSYYENHPEDFWKRGLEPLYIDINNIEIMATHLVAMVADCPVNYLKLSEKEIRIVEKLVEEGILRRKRNYLFITRKGWAFLRKRMNLRGVGEMVKIVSENNKTIGFREKSMAIKELFPGAIYIHGGIPYLSLKFKNNIAVVRRLPKNIALYTVPLYYTVPDEIDVLEEKTIYNIPVKYLKLNITDTVYAYIVKDFFKNIKIKEEILKESIEYKFNTKGILINFPYNDEWTDIENAEAFHAIEHALISISQTIIGASLSDMGGVSFPTGHIYIYDAFPGGSGLSYQLYNDIVTALKRAYRLVNECNCIDGCPKCIYSPYCGNNNMILSRKRARYVLNEVLMRKVRRIEISRMGKPIV